MIETEDSKELKRDAGKLMTDECLMCDLKLILDANGTYGKYHCCSEHTRYIESEVRKVLNDVDMGRKAHKRPNRVNLAFRDKCVQVTHMGEV